MNIECVTFVGGSGRCGTTLICQLLDVHPEVASIFEVHTLITFLQCLREERLPDAEVEGLYLEDVDHGLSLASEYNWRFRREEVLHVWLEKVKAALESGEPLQTVIRRWSDYLHRLQMVRDGSTRIIHKTPALAAYLPEIWRLWPSGRFLHMIRDPRDVIASYLAQDWGPTNTTEGIEWYCERVGLAIAHGRGDERYLEVKMEDLVENPGDVLDRVQLWAGLAPETERMLAQIYVNPGANGSRGNLLDQKSSRRIYEETASRIPALYELYKP